jgi:hypothetical protein
MDMETFESSTPGQNQFYQPQYPETGRGTLILILGIVSLTCFGPLTGIPAWVLGNTDLKKIKFNRIAPSEQSNTRAGKILGIIGTFLPALFFVIGIAVVVGANLFQASAVDANRNALVADINRIGLMAHQYYEKPVALGGGGKSYRGFTIPDALSHTANGKYNVIVYDQQVVIIGEGIEPGDDGAAILHQAIISPTSTSIFKKN